MNENMWDVRRAWRTKGEERFSRNYYEILPGKLTVDPSYAVGMWLAPQGTLFEEIEVVPWEEAVGPDGLAFLDETVQFKTEETKRAAARDLVDLMEVAVEDTWDPTKFHVIASSSGEDSRCLLHTLTTLRDRKGPEWLGRVLFYCCEWEWPTFMKGMLMGGWDPEQYWLYRRHVSPGYYWDEALDFSTAWEAYNGPSGQARNYFFFPIRAAQRKGLLPEDPDEIQLFTMLGPLIAITPRARGVSSKLWYEKLLEAVIPSGIEDTIHVPLYREILRRVAISKSGIGKYWADMCLVVANPALAALPNLCAHQGDRQRSAEGTIAESSFERVVEDYETSWYGREVAPGAVREATRSLHYSTWWGRWSAACICEHLIGEGYELRCLHS